MHLWWVYLHILGGLLFMLAHGASAAVVFRLRRERDPAAVRVLLGLSRRFDLGTRSPSLAVPAPLQVAPRYSHSLLATPHVPHRLS